MDRASLRTQGRIAMAFGMVSFLVLAPGGCARQAELTLHQPFAPPAQQHLKLMSESAFHALSGPRQTYAVAVPLPGAVEGPRAFVIYLTAPDQTGKLRVAPGDPAAVRGFLIQELGSLAGRSDFVAGALLARKVFLSPRMRQLDLNLRTEDGAVLTGRVYTENVPRGVQVIEREFAADVALLTPPSTESVDDAEEAASAAPAPQE